MSENVSKPESNKRLDLAVDITTTFGGVAAGVLSFSATPLVAGVATAVLFPAVILSMFNLTARTALNQEHEFAKELLKMSGVARIWNIYSDSKVSMQNKMKLTLFFALIGVAGAGGKYWSDQDQIDRKQMQQELRARPILDSGTVLKRTEVKASDFCVTRHGKKLPSGYVIPMEHNGTQYQVICP